MDSLGLSRIFGRFAYAGQKGCEGRMEGSVKLVVPPGGRFLEVQLFKFYAGSLILLETPALQLSIEALPASASEQTAEAEVLPGEEYEIISKAWARAKPTKRSAVAVFAFLDAAGKVVEPPADIPVSKSVGPYRYLEFVQSEGGAPVPGVMAVEGRATVTPPEGAVRIRVMVRPWQSKGLLEFTATVCRPTSFTEEIMASGTETLRIGERFALSGEYRFEDANSAPLVARFLFRDSNGDLVFDKSDDQGEARPRRHIYVLAPERGCLSASLPANVKAPARARTVSWRIARMPETKVVELRAPRFLRLRFAGEEHFAPLPPEARGVTDILQEEANRLRETTAAATVLPPPAPRNRLVGELACAVTSSDWQQVTIRTTEHAMGKVNPAILAFYFDPGGMLLTPERLHGCYRTKDQAFQQEMCAAKDLPNTFHACFLPPREAEFALYLVVSADCCPVKLIQHGPLAKDELFSGIKLDNLSEDQLKANLAVAELIWDLKARARLVEALALHGKESARFSQRLRILHEQLLELDTAWLPRVPALSGYIPDPSSVLHLLKVVYPGESSGGAVRSASILKAQVKVGLKPVAVMPVAPPPGQDPDGMLETMYDGAKRVHLNFRALRANQLANATLLEFEAALIQKVCRKECASLIHATSGFRGYENALKGLAVAQRENLPMVYEVRSFHEETWRPLGSEGMSDQLTRMRKAQEDRCMQAADAVATISLAMIDNLRSRGIPENKIFFVPNSISGEFETLYDQCATAEIRKSHGFEGRTVLGYISNFSKREGHSVFLEAFALLAASRDDLHLLLVGDGSEREIIAGQAAELGLAERVSLPGNVDHEKIKAWYGAIDIFVVPRVADFASDHVTPLKPFEAMSQGIPVLMSDRPVTREIAGKDGQRAGVFRSGDPAALAEALRHALATPDELRARADAARRWVLAERTWSRTVSRYGDIYAKARDTHAMRSKGKRA